MFLFVYYRKCLIIGTLCITIMVILFETFVVVHCEWDDWVIGECNKECGGGMRTNTRTEKVSAEHGGEECPGPASVDESCNVHECPGYRMLHIIASYH